MSFLWEYEFQRVARASWQRELDLTRVARKLPLHTRRKVIVYNGRRLTHSLEL